jgi:hypothetical protein
MPAQVVVVNEINDGGWFVKVCINVTGIFVTRLVVIFPKNGSIFPMIIPRNISTSLMVFTNTKIYTHGVQDRMRL